MKLRLVAKNPWEADLAAVEVELGPLEPLAVQNIHLPAYVEGRFETRPPGPDDDSLKWTPLTTWARIYDFRVVGKEHAIDGNGEL